MALIIGSKNADAGMSQAIYQEMDKLLSPPLEDAVSKAKQAQAQAQTQGDNAKEQAAKVLQAAQDALNKARAGWQKLAFAIANGVINHITANLEVFGVKVQGNVTTTVTGDTDRSNPGNHLHRVFNLPGVANNVVFTQNNDGVGRVR